MAIGGQEPRRSAEVESALMWQEPAQKESACQELARQEIAQQAPVRGPSAQAMRRRTARSGTRGRAGDHANTRRFFWMFASFDQFAFPNSHLPFRRRRPRPPQASCCHPSVIAKRRLVLLWNNEKLPPFQYVVPYCACARSSSVPIGARAERSHSAPFAHADEEGAHRSANTPMPLSPLRSAVKSLG